MLKKSPSLHYKQQILKKGYVRLLFSHKHSNQPAARIYPQSQSHQMNTHCIVPVDALGLGSSNLYSARSADCEHEVASMR